MPALRDIFSSFALNGSTFESIIKNLKIERAKEKWGASEFSDASFFETSVTHNMEGSPSSDSDSNASSKHHGTKKDKFSPAEDSLLAKLVRQYGTNNWSIIAKQMKNRKIRQIRERWRNYLCPCVNNSPWSPEEEALLELKVKEEGKHWVSLAKYFNGRTDVNIKNQWVTITRQNRRLQGKAKMNEVDSSFLLCGQDCRGVCSKEDDIFQLEPEENIWGEDIFM